MATSEETSIMNNLEDMTQCCICCETFTDPRILPCIHTFCFGCLRKTGLHMKKRPGHVMPCPICKEEFPIPKKGWDDIKKNFFMVKLIEMTAAAAKSSDQSRSIPCSRCDAQSQAEVNLCCIQCCKNLCPHCGKKHQKRNPTHQVRVNCTESTTTIARSSASAVCKLHPQKPTHLYCTDCNECICARCSAAGHRGHSCVSTDLASVEFRKEIGLSIERVSGCMMKCKAKKDKLEEDKVKFLKELKEIEKEVNSDSHELKALVKKHKESLLAELSSIAHRRVKQIETENSEVERHMTLSESFKLYCTDVYTKGSPSDICQSVSNLRSMSKEMQAMMESCVERKLPSDQIFLAKSKLNASVESTQEWNVIGEIKVLSKASVELKKRVDVAAKGIHGVAKLSRNIYVLCRAPNSIFVYADESPFNLKKEIVTEDILQPRDLAACTKSNCLYITDGYSMFMKSGNRCVWKMTNETNYMNVWRSDIESPWTISVCKDGRVVMLRDYEHRARLEVYQSDSTLAQSLLMPDDVREPLHAIESSAGNFIISCRYGGLWSLCEIALDGNIVAQYLPENGPERLDYPCHLVKYFDDRVIVADRNNHRVVLLNLKPKISQILLTRRKYAVKRPRLVLCDPDAKQMIVVHGVFRGRKMLDIYSINN